MENSGLSLYVFRKKLNSSLEHFLKKILNRKTVGETK